LYTNLEDVVLTNENDLSDTLVGGNYQATYQDANFFNCHAGTCYEVSTIPSEFDTFLSCGDDGSVRYFDLRVSSKCFKQFCRENIIILAPGACTSMSVAPISNNYLSVGCADSVVRIYDRRYLKLVEFSSDSPSTSATSSPLSKIGPEMMTKPVKMFKIPNNEKRSFRITSVNFSSDDSQLLVSFSSEYLYLFNMKCDGISDDQVPKKIEKQKCRTDSPRFLRKLRLRGDWTDCGEK
jgi:nuclear receptor interaction protein